MTPARFFGTYRQSFLTRHNLTMNAPQKPAIHPEFQRYIDRQPYQVELDGFLLNVENDVFPPDMGQCAQNLAKLCGEYPAQVALDMGCGSGYLALALKRAGIAEVWASDIHPPAVACARRNFELNRSVGPINLVAGDLFSSIPVEVKFDLVIFNQPFGPGKDTVCGCGTDGGYQITRRFLLEATQRVSDAGAIIMAFSDREPAENSPDAVARELGLPVKTLFHAFYGGANNYIFEIRPHALG